MFKFLRSRRVITLIIAIVFAIAAFFGVVIPADLQSQIIAIIAALTL